MSKYITKMRKMAAEYKKAVQMIIKPGYPESEYNRYLNMLDKRGVSKFLKFAEREMSPHIPKSDMEKAIKVFVKAMIVANLGPSDFHDIKVISDSIVNSKPKYEIVYNDDDMDKDIFFPYGDNEELLGTLTEKTSKFKFDVYLPMISKLISYGKNLVETIPKETPEDHVKILENLPVRKFQELIDEFVHKKTGAHVDFNKGMVSFNLMSRVPVEKMESFVKEAMLYSNSEKISLIKEINSKRLLSDVNKNKGDEDKQQDLTAKV